MNTRKIDAMDVEHIGSLVIGGLVFLKGLTTGGPLGAIYKLGGVGLIYRGQQGYGRLHRALGRNVEDRPSGVGKQNVKVEHSIIVKRSPMDLYKVWRHFENLPIFMSYLEEVREIDDTRSEWTAKAPLGMVVRWKADIINDIPGELIAWQTVEGSGVDNAGSVRFEPFGDDATVLKVTLRYDPPADMGGFAVAKLFGMDAQKQIERDLRAFKDAMEARSVDGVTAIGSTTSGVSLL